MPNDAHEVPLQVRFGDTDALGHVNNAAFAAYAEIGRLEFFREVVGLGVGSVGDAAAPPSGADEPGGGLILARLAIDFRAQVRFPAALRVVTRVARLGSSSVTLHQEVLEGATVAAEIGSVVVHFDYAEQRPAPLPGWARGRLEPFLVGAAAEADAGG